MAGIPCSAKRFLKVLLLLQLITLVRAGGGGGGVSRKTACTGRFYPKGLQVYKRAEISQPEVYGMAGKGTKYTILMFLVIISAGKA